MGGPLLLPWSEIEAWTRITPQFITYEEIDMLCSMDHAYIAQASIEREDRREREKEQAELEKSRKPKRTR